MDQKSVEVVLKEKKIYEIINPALVRGASSLSLEEAVGEMKARTAGYIVIEENEKPVGMFTEVDMVRRVLGENVDWSAPITNFMTKDPFVLRPDDTVYRAIEMMGKHNFYHIPLVNERNKLVGVLSVRSLIRFLSEFYPTEVYNLPPHSNQVMDTPEGG